MTPTAITFLALSATVIWGGLTASVLRLRRDTRAARLDDEADED